MDLAHDCDLSKNLQFINVRELGQVMLSNVN